MQVYQGLDIGSAKVTADETHGVVHHMLSILPAHHQGYTVHDFQRACQSLIARLTEQGIIPIIVGGTFYYIEALLWDTLLNTDEHNLKPEACLGQEELADTSSSSSPSSAPIPSTLSSSTTELYERLKQVDPVMANKLHPRDRRKIERSLAIFDSSGQRQSDLIRAKGHRGPPRLRCTMFWLDCEPKVTPSSCKAR